MKINGNGESEKTNPIQTQSPKSQNEYKLTYNKGLQKKRRFCSPNKQSQFLQRPKMNANLYIARDYENETTFRPKKTNPNKPNFKPGDGVSPQVRLSAWGHPTAGTPYGRVPGTAYYTRDCHANLRFARNDVLF